MKVSKSTIEILKNFSTINQNILITEGNVLKTKSVANNLFASAEVDTHFPKDFGIYNLSTLLGVISLFSDPDIELGDTSMTISQGKNRVQYLFASPDVLCYPDKVVRMPSADAKFELSEENLKSLLKAGAILSSTDLKISGDGSVITCTVIDPKNVSSNTFTVDVGNTTREFNAFIKLENLKLLSGKYVVSLSSKKIAHFQNAAINYSLFVTNEKNSNWVTKD